jgi:tetratricopeptide (TPR) repeat protein
MTGLDLVVGLVVLLAFLFVAAPALAATEHPYNSGCEALARGDVKKAKAFFQEAVKLDPRDTDALNNLAVCFIRMGDYDEALPLLQKVLRLNKRYRGADLNIGATYIFGDDLTRAGPPTEHATAGGTTAAAKRVKADAYYNLGLIAAREGRFADAHAAFERSLEVQSTVAASIGLACSLCALGEFDSGLPILETASSEDEETAATLKADLAAAYCQRGMQRLAQGDLAGAEEDFARSSEAVENEYALMGQAIVVAERGDRAEAAALLDEVRASTESPDLQRAAQTNLVRLEALADDETQWLKWLVLAVGALLFAFQTYVLVGALAASPRRDGAVVWKVVLGILVGLAAAVVLVLAFLDPFRGPLWVAVALVIDLLVVAFVWRATSGVSGTAQSA